MTRTQEIDFAWKRREVKSNYRYDERSFKEAVEWADNTMIDKACEWLIRGGYFVNSNETIEDFRKAMEE